MHDYIPKNHEIDALIPVEKSEVAKQLHMAAAGLTGISVENVADYRSDQKRQDQAKKAVLAWQSARRGVSAQAKSRAVSALDAHHKGEIVHVRFENPELAEEFSHRLVDLATGETVDEEHVKPDRKVDPLKRAFASERAAGFVTKALVQRGVARGINSPRRVKGYDEAHDEETNMHGVVDTLKDIKIATDNEDRSFLDRTA